MAIPFNQLLFNPILKRFKAFLMKYKVIPLTGDNSRFIAKKGRLTGLNYQSHQALFKVLDDYNQIIVKMRSDYRLNYTSVELLNCLYFNYHFSGLPISINALHKKAHAGTWYSIKERLLAMEVKGLVVSSVSSLGYKVFSPSVVVIDFYSSLSIQLLPFFSKI